MQWIPEYLVKNISYTNDAQTLYIDLPKNEQISFIQLDISAQYAVAAIQATVLMNAISKYEVVADGSKVLYSLEPELAYYVDFITHDGVLPPMGFSSGPGYRDTHRFIIPFGRHEFDEEYMLDTSLYNNVQLRIEYDISAAATFTAGTFRVNALAYRPLEKLSPVGLIRSRCVRKETTSAAAQTITHDLPMEYPLRYVAVRVEDQDQNIETVLTGIKLNIDEGRLVLADMNDNEWVDADARRFPKKSEYKIMAARVHEEYFPSYVDYPVPTAFVSSAPLALFHKIYHAIGENLAISQYTEDGASTSSSYAIDVYLKSSNPHSCVTILDGRESPFEVARYSQGKVEYTQAAYVVIFHTFVQEVVTGSL